MIVDTDKTVYTVEILKRRAWYNFPWTVWIHKNGECLDCELTWTKSGAKRWAARKVRAAERRKHRKSQNETYQTEV